MKHLTFEEIIDFISFQSLDENTVKLIQKVNGHICKCAACREKVKAYQTVADGFSGIADENSVQIRDEKNIGQNEAPKFAAAHINSITKEKIPQMRKE